MKTFARCLSNPDQPDDNTVIELAEAEEWWQIAWTVPDILTWITVEVTEATGFPLPGAHYDGKAFEPPPKPAPKKRKK